VASGPRADADLSLPEAGGGTPAIEGTSKAATGIDGLDRITGGGLPRGRATLVHGGPGCGKTLLAVNFLVHGAVREGEPGVLVAFEETSHDLSANTAALGMDLDGLRRSQQLAVVEVRLESTETVEAGAYDLGGLLSRVEHAVDTVGAKRIVFDTIEVLLDSFTDRATIRTELRRILRWLKDRGLTVVVTGERGGVHGIGEYVSDCVIFLDQRVDQDISTRRLRVLKYRGSPHGTNEYPFLIDDTGIEVVPITSLRLDHPAPTERVCTGIDRLDTMLNGGIYRASSVLISGSAGTGKSSLAALFLDAGCRRGERGLYVSYEESEEQVIRNMSSIGLDLRRWVDEGLLRFHTVRPSSSGLEMHLVALQRLVAELAPTLVVVDTMSALARAAGGADLTSQLTRQIDFLKEHGITTVFIAVTSPGEAETDLEISSLIDTWVLLRAVEVNGERNRLLDIVKARGTAHSNQVREFLLTDHGAELIDVYLGAEGVLTGSARIQQEVRERERAAGRRRELDRQRQEIEAEMADLRRRLVSAEEGFKSLEAEQSLADVGAAEAQEHMARHRWADLHGDSGGSGPGA